MSSANPFSFPAAPSAGASRSLSHDRAPSSKAGPPESFDSYYDRASGAGGTAARRETAPEKSAMSDWSDKSDMSQVFETRKSTEARDEPRSARREEPKPEGVAAPESEASRKSEPERDAETNSRPFADAKPTASDLGPPPEAADGENGAKSSASGASPAEAAASRIVTVVLPTGAQFRPAGGSAPAASGDTATRPSDKVHLTPAAPAATAAAAQPPPPAVAASTTATQSPVQPPAGQTPVATTAATIANTTASVPLVGTQTIAANASAVAQGLPATPSTPATAPASTGDAAEIARNAAPQAGHSQGEKIAARTSSPVSAEVAQKESTFLTAHKEQLTDQGNKIGIDDALPSDRMKSPSPNSQRLPGFSATRGSFTQGAGESDGGANLSSVTWKGWTNGGGERTSTAAQFSRLGDTTPSAQLGLGQSAPVFPGLRVTGPATPAPTAAPQPTVPVSESFVLGSISSAIERLVARGTDQLSVTVRFEQGGSVSLKLSMQGNEIATRIQTDLPGLESTLKSSWSQFAADWEGRGFKLATPVFTAGSSAQQQQPQPQPQHQHDTGRQDARGFNREADDFFSERGPGRDRQREHAPAQREGWPRRSDGSFSSRRPLVAAAPVSTLSVDRDGLHTWA